MSSDDGIYALYEKTQKLIALNPYRPICWYPVPFFKKSISANFWWKCCCLLMVEVCSVWGFTECFCVRTGCFDPEKWRILNSRSNNYFAILLTSSGAALEMPFIWISHMHFIQDGRLVGEIWWMMNIYSGQIWNYKEKLMS